MAPDAPDRRTTVDRVPARRRFCIDSNAHDLPIARISTVRGRDGTMMRGGAHESPSDERVAGPRGSIVEGCARRVSVRGDRRRAPHRRCEAASRNHDGYRDKVILCIRTRACDERLARISVVRIPDRPCFGLIVVRSDERWVHPRCLDLFDARDREIAAERACGDGLIACRIC